MSRILGVVAVLVTASVVATVAAAGPVAARQRIAIQMRGSAHTWSLKPLTAGTIEPDEGFASFCCYTSHNIVRDGQAIEIDDPTVTLVGKQGNLVIRNRIEWINIPDGWAVANMTWKVISGTGVYAGLSGGGRGTGVTTSTAKLKARFDGYLSRN